MHEDETTHQFMYPEVAPVSGSAPGTDSDGRASSADIHNDTVGGAPSRAQEEPASGPPVRRDGPLRSEQPGEPPTRSE